MIGSVVESLVSSAELARSFCKEEKVKDEDLDGTDGIHAFTKASLFGHSIIPNVLKSSDRAVVNRQHFQIIDAIISRFYVKFSNTIVRFEKLPQPPSNYVTAICVDIEQ